MALASTSMIVPKRSQEAIIQFHHQCYQMLGTQWNFRENMRAVDLAYIRENDWTSENIKAKIVNRYGDANKYQNITVPVVMPQVESAVTYQASVFLTGTPIFGCVASPEFEDEAMQLESVIDENSVRGAWVRELMMTFRDGFKYNFAPLEVTWDRKTVSSLTTDINYGKGIQGKPTDTIWEGNCLHRRDPYNTFIDSRVSPTSSHVDGEFAGYTELMSRVKLKQFINDLPDKIYENIVLAFESGFGAAGISGGLESFYIPQINPAAILNRDIRATTNWLAWAGISGSDNKILYKNVYEVTTLYGKIIPADFNLRVPGANTPQIWKFIIVNHSVLIYAERQTNAHNYLPILIAQPYEDGLGYQTKSLGNNVLPIQEVSSALMNSIVAARRRSISDRGLYDPSRVAKADINSINPSAKIPVKPSAYGKPLQEAYYPIPFNDDQSPLMMQQIQSLSGLANTISGQNPVKQGQFVKGNKTQHEFDSVMSNANGRDQMVSMLLEAQLFTPVKEILKYNILQYQGTSSVYNRNKNKAVKIDPIALRNATLNFKISDGLTPTDKLINEDVLMVAMQQIGSSPQIGAGYNIAPLFSYIMKTQGAHLKEFEKSPAQIAYEQATQQWQQLVMQLMKQNPDIKAEQYPPQPQPQQFGYDPSGGATQPVQQAA